MRNIEGASIDQLAKTIQSLRSNLDELEDTSAGDEVAGPIRDRIALLTHGVVEATAQSGPELARKANVLLYWLDPVCADVPHLLSASLCRDVVLMFPAET